MRNVIKEYLPILIKGSVNYKDGVPSLIIDTIMEPENIQRKKDLEINICGEQNPKILEEFKELLKKHPGETKLKIVYGADNNRKYLIKSVTPVRALTDFIEKYNCN